MQDTGELVRPYAIAAFQQAQQEDKLSEWSDMLALLQTIVSDTATDDLINSPKVEGGQLVSLILDVGSDAFSPSVQNLIRLLAEYGKLSLVPQLVEIFNAERTRCEGRSEVEVTSAYELTAEQEQTIGAAMKQRLGTEVNLDVSIDKTLIGGVVIRSGDLVIDASLRGRLQELSQTLI